MKTIFTSLIFLLPTTLWTQTIDSTIIRQVDSLIQVSRTLTGQQEFDRALELSAAAEKLALEKLGRETAEYGNCCHNRGRIMHIKGDYPEAEKWYIDAQAIREKVLGKEHAHYTGTLNNLALLYMTMGQYEKAEPLHLEAKAIREKALGKEHPDYAATLYNLSIMYRRMGQYEKAEPLSLEAKIIREKALGIKHPDYANSLDGLASLYLRMGQYEKAEPLYLESKDIREKALGKEHPGYTMSLNNLALLFFYMGQYEKAEPLYLEDIAIKEKVLGMENPNYASSLSNLEALYSIMGQYEKAEPFCLEAKAIREKALGKEHPDYAASVSNLGGLYSDMGQYEKAEPFCLEAKAIREKALGKEHPDYANSLNNLAKLYHSMGHYEKAEPLYLEAKDIRGKILGEEHPIYSGTLGNLANLYMNMGQYEKAELFFLKVKSSMGNILGKEHPNYALTLGNLAMLYHYMENYEKVELLFLELSTVNQTLIAKALLHLSERELNIYMHQFSITQDQTLSFTQMKGSEMLIPTCYDNSLFFKGFLLNAANQIKRLALSDSISTDKFNRLKGYQRSLAALYSLPNAGRDSSKVAALETKATELEKDLTRTVAGFGEALKQVKWQEVQQALKPGEAAIEYVHYRYYEKEQTDSTMYAALLLLPGNAQPKFISLFEEKSLDSLLQSQGERRADYVNDLYTVADRGVAPVGKPNKSMYELLWQPLGKALEGIHTIYFSPSGLLHRLNLSAIPITDDETLADRYRLVQLNSTRQLVVPTEVNQKVKEAMLYGGVQFEMDSTAIAAANIDYNEVLVASRGAISFSTVDSTNRGGTWNYLKYTEKEISNIGGILTNAGIITHNLKGFSATEKSFKAIGRNGTSPRILHLATHGFFFPDPGAAATTLQKANGNRDPVFELSDHPMIRSGLILAGGNHAWQTGKPFKPEMEDGILTAYEISQMNLSNTELVVLSACETGLGDIQGNEGVYGLQRAFKIAGAKYLVMSLWQVPDQETSIFMETFYRNWMEDKMSIPEAFRTTQKEMRERFINPYQWAGFVLVE